MSPAISLIVTVYNRAHYLSLTLDSILAQTYADFELLIWDDGSDDHSVAVAQAYARRDDRIRIVAASHQGFPGSIRDAVARTTAPYVGWVDSDDLLAPTALAETIAVLNAHPNIGLVYTNHIIIDEHGNDKGLGRLCRIPYSKDRLLLDFVVMHFRLIRRSIYEQVGGIDPTFTTAEDYDLCLKISEITDIYHLPKALYYYRRHSGNVTNQQLEVIRSAHQAITNALHRRGLDQHYHLKVTPTFSLRPKPAPQSLPTPPLEPLAPNALAPLVSIIIPAYNAAPRLHHCLQSCIHQTYPNLEIILVDNGSIDNTIQIAQEIAQTTTRPIQIHHCPQRGANHARNFGFVHAQGDYIQWLDADDDLAPDKISRQLIALVEQPEADIAYGDWDWCFWQDRQLIAQLRFADRAYTDFILQTLLDNWRPPHAYLLRRTAALQLHHLQAWNPDTTVYMDREYFTLAALLGLQFLHIPNSFVCYHRWSNTQVSRTATYLDRVHHRRQIFRRLQDIAQVCQGTKLSRSHQFLLQQNWELWHPAFTLIKQTDQTFALQHNQTQEHRPITWQEANIARVLLQSAKPRAIEDHTRKVIQLLWLEILVELSQSQSSTLNYDQIADKLAWRIGCNSDSVTPEVSAEWETIPRIQKPSTDSIPLHPLLQEVPLFTPLLSEERFVVQQFLDRLRQDNWLRLEPSK
jgi:glycosyltransferase involved in cell wall biosynthesis